MYKNAEIAEAMDQVRAVRHLGEIVLLTPRVVDLTVDRVVSWRTWPGPAVVFLK